MYNLSIGAVFRNETQYLNEWITYHEIIGIEHFYLLCNDDKIDLPKNITNKTNITITHFIDREAPHDNGIKYILKNYGHLTKWLAIIDIDEFIFLTKNLNLNKFLERYETSHIGALAIFWSVFGSNNILKRNNNELIIESFFQRAKKLDAVNRLMKCIIRPDRVKESKGAHFNLYHNGYYAVDENFKKMPSGLNGHKSWRVNYTTTKNIRINHYAVKSKYDFKLKKQRGYSRPKDNNTFNWNHYWNTFDKNEVRDDTMKRFIPQVKEKLSGSFTL